MSVFFCHTLHCLTLLTHFGKPHFQKHSIYIYFYNTMLTYCFLYFDDPNNTPFWLVCIFDTLLCLYSDFVILQITPPFKPQVTSDTDTRYFDSEFTGESVELTPPEHQGTLNSIAEEFEQAQQPYFPQFSYQDLGSTLGSSTAISLSTGSLVQH